MSFSSFFILFKVPTPGQRCLIKDKSAVLLLFSLNTGCFAVFGQKKPTFKAY
jgi:hypothetical protein